MKIADLFDTPIEEKIEPVIKVGERGDEHSEDRPAERQPRMPPEGLPEGHPPGFTYRPGLLAHDACPDGRPEARPVRFDRLEILLAHEGLEAGKVLRGGAASGAAPQVGGHEAPRTRSQGTVGAPLEAGTHPGTGHAPHGQQYTSTAWTAIPA